MTEVQIMRAPELEQIQCVPKLPQISSDPELNKLKALLGKFVASGEEVGANITVDNEGRTVVDIWGDNIDEQQIQLWEKNTIVNVWSSTKIILSLTTMMLVDRGLLDVNEKVCKYLPDFAAKGEENVLVRQFLSPTSGASSWDKPVTIENASELVRRTDGRTLEQFITEELAGSLGADFQRRGAVERPQDGCLQRRLRPLVAVEAKPDGRNGCSAEGVPASEDRKHMAKLYPDSIPPHPLHPYARDFSVLDQGSIGKALVTHRRWHRGDFMARFDGITVPEVMLHTLQKTDRVHLWDPYFIGNLAHSCAPNVMLDMAEHEIWAVEDIEPGVVPLVAEGKSPVANNVAVASPELATSLYELLSLATARTYIKLQAKGNDIRSSS